MARVYSYTVYSELHQSTITQPFKATAESIMMLGGDIVPGTEEDVPDDELDGSGRFIGRPEREEGT